MVAIINKQKALCNNQFGVKFICISIVFIVFWNDTVHVSDGLSVHHQEFKTVHTVTGICQTNTAVCLLAGT